VLLAYTLDLERESEQALPLSANFVRVLDEKGMDVREVPFAAGVSSEATSMALKLVTKSGHVVVETKVVRLTPKGREAQEAARVLHAELEKRWRARFGAAEVRRLRTALDGVLDQREGERLRLSLGLEPHPDGWRASKRYVEQTNAVVADPLGRLPHYPMVLHRGGWPDGS
jgi:Mn-dependent DtxR family transcriptional regulator